MEVLTQHVFWGPVNRLGILEEETHYRADRSTHLFSSYPCWDSPWACWCVRSGGCDPQQGDHAVSGQTFPELPPTSLPCLGGDLLGPRVSPSSPWPHTLPPFLVGLDCLRQQEDQREGSESAFLSLSSVPVGFLQVTSVSLNGTLSAYFSCISMSIFSIHDNIFRWNF